MLSQSTLLDRLSVIYKELLEEFLAAKPTEEHSEEKFVKFLKVEKGYSSGNATGMLRSAIWSSCHTGCDLEKFTSEASKDSSFPISMEIFNKLLFPNSVFMDPSSAQFTSARDYRNSETENFHIVSAFLKKATNIEKWISHKKVVDFSTEQKKARRCWHKGAVLTWDPFLKEIIINSFNIQTQEEREKLLYRPVMSYDVKSRVEACINRFFGHPMWNEPEGELDTLLVSAVRHTDYFEKKESVLSMFFLGLTIKKTHRIKRAFRPAMDSLRGRGKTSFNKRHDRSLAGSLMGSPKWLFRVAW